MDRARDRGARRPGHVGAANGARAGGALRIDRRAAGVAAVLSAGLACSQLSPDLESIIALEIVLPDSGFFALGDTLFPRARPLNGRGDSVAAKVSWATLDPAVLDVNDTTGATMGVDSGGAGRIQARVGNLPSNPLTVVAQEPLDTIYVVGNRVADTVTVSGTPRDTLSDSVQIQVRAPTPAPRMTPAQALVRRRVTFVTQVFPAAGRVVTLVPNDTGFTNTSGIVVVQVRLDAGVAPDSVVVTARAVQRDTVPGSPFTFVVEFRQ